MTWDAVGTWGSVAGPPIGRTATADRPIRATMTGVIRRRRVAPDAAHVDGEVVSIDAVRARTVVDPVADSLRRAGTGDEAAFAEFYDHVVAVVYGTVVRVVRDPSMAEEVTQEVFVELWRQAPRFDGERGSPQAWATTVARRRAIDRVRSVQAARDRDAADATRAERPHDSVVDQIVDHDEQAQLAEALAGLSDLQREALTLAYYGGHTYREVAELLGVPEGTVKTRLRDGLIRLRDQMGAPR